MRRIADVGVDGLEGVGGGVNVLELVRGGDVIRRFTGYGEVICLRDCVECERWVLGRRGHGTHGRG